jgi:rhomboid protease GluP
MNNPFDPSQKSYPSAGPVHPLERQPVPPLSRPPQAPPPQAAPVRQVYFPFSRPILAYGILALNIVIFGVDHYFLNGMLTHLGAKDNAPILAGQLWRFVTPMFLHVNEIHIAVNSYSLMIIGPQVERSFGHWRFAAIYLLSGIAGAIASFMFSPYPSVGASGALFGLIGALLPLLYRNRSVLADTRRRIVSIVQVIVINLAIGLLPGIDDWAHLGGLVGGLSLGWFAAPLYKVLQDVDGSIRVRDESSASLVWLAIIFLGTMMGGIIFLEILLRGGSFWPRGGFQL